MKIELSRHIFKMQANVIVRLDVEIFVFVSRANCKFHPKVFVFAKRCKVVQKYFPLPAFSSTQKHGAYILTVVYILQILQILEEYIPLIRKHGACILSPGWHFFSGQLIVAVSSIATIKFYCSALLDAELVGLVVPRLDFIVIWCSV